MVRIIVITHTYDNFCSKNSLLASVGQHWVDAGHEVSVVAGLGNWPEGDVAVMHVDFSVVPAAYAEAAKRYPIVVNGAALDIRKRRVSRNLVAQNDGWDGPVVVKTDLNYHGIPEMHAAQMARHDGRPAEMPSGSMVAMNRSYPIFRSPPARFPMRSGTIPAWWSSAFCRNAMRRATGFASGCSAEITSSACAVAARIRL